MFSLEIKLSFDSKEKAKRFFSSIKPMLGEEFLRGKSTVALKDSLLEFVISAQDKTTLSSSLNSLIGPLESFNEFAGI